MADTTFVPHTTPVTADWLNDINDAVYHDLGGVGGLSSSAGASKVGFMQAGTGATLRTLQDKDQEVVSVKDFGAVGDGVTDDYSAIMAAYNATASGKSLYFPAGQYCYLTPLAFTSNKKISLLGDGPRQTLLIYKGANTTSDCVVFGDGSVEQNGLLISGIGFRSETQMTAGAGVHFKRLTRSRLTNVLFEDQDHGSPKFYIGVWFDGADFVTLSGFQARGSAEGLRVNGIVGSGPKADLYVSDGKIGGSGVGIHIAGAFGGFYLDSTDVIGNGTNILIDQAVAAENNRETFIGPGTALDSAGTGGLYNGVGLFVDDTSGYVVLSGTWIATAGTLIKTGANYTGNLRMAGGILFNALTSDGGNGNAVEIGNAGANVTISGTPFNVVQGTGVICTAGSAATNVEVNGIRWITTPGTKFSNVNTTTSATVSVSMGRQAVYGRTIFGGETPISGAVDGSPKASWLMGASGGASLCAGHFDASSANAWFEFAKSRNTTLGSHTIVQNNDVLGGINFAGSDGSAFVSGATIKAKVSGTPAAGDMPTYLEIQTRAQGGALTPRMQVDPSGNVIPVTTNLYNLGTTNNRWKQGYIIDPVFQPLASVTPASNGDMQFQLTSNTSLTIKVKGTDGVVRSGSITLA